MTNDELRDKIRKIVSGDVLLRNDYLFDIITAEKEAEGRAVAEEIKKVSQKYRRNVSSAPFGSAMTNAVVDVIEIDIDHILTERYGEEK